VVVERAQLTSLEQGNRLREADLNRSIENAGSNVEAETEAIATLREDDNQIYEAFTLLKGINVYQSLGATPHGNVDETPEEASSGEG
jgi:carboxyl-terminal processing protease